MGIGGEDWGLGAVGVVVDLFHIRERCLDGGTVLRIHGENIRGGGGIVKRLRHDLSSCRSSSSEEGFPSYRCVYRLGGEHKTTCCLHD